MKNFIIIMVLVQTMLIFSNDGMSLPEIGLYRVVSCLTSKSENKTIQSKLGSNLQPRFYIRIGKDTIDTFVIIEYNTEHYSKKYILEGSYDKSDYIANNNIYYVVNDDSMIYKRKNKYYFDNDEKKLLLKKSDDDLSKIIPIDDNRLGVMIATSIIDDIHDNPACNINDYFSE